MVEFILERVPSFRLFVLSVSLDWRGRLIDRDYGAWFWDGACQLVSVGQYYLMAVYND